MKRPDAHTRLSALTRGRGRAALTLGIGAWRIRFAGLDEPLVGELTDRWGPFVEPGGAGTAEAVVRVLDDSGGDWLAPPRHGEPYRMEAAGSGDRRVIVSWAFAMTEENAQGRTWRLALSRAAGEPATRSVENAARVICARLALAHGGFALHGAGVLGAGQAYLFAGPSRSGKSTAVRLCAPAPSLGDDFAFVVPAGPGEWWTAAVPFDNATRIEPEPPRGWLPVAGIWRLFHGLALREERPPAALALASLLGCVAFPWVLPERSAELTDHASRFAETRRFAHLYFAVDSDLWSVLTGRGAP